MLKLWKSLSSVWLFCDPMGYTIHGILQARILEWVAFRFSRRSSQPQGSNPGLPRCRWILYQLRHKGSPRILEWVAYPFSRGSSRPRNWAGVSCVAGGFFTSWATREAYIKVPYLVRLKEKAELSIQIARGRQLLKIMDSNYYKSSLMLIQCFIKNMRK